MSPPPSSDATLLAPASAQAPPRAQPSVLRSAPRAFALLGPGYLIAVGYMDPGNWATDLAGGSRWGYALLWVVVLSGFMAMFLQVLAARLGIVSGLDLAQASRRHSHPRTVFAQWLACEVAIVACDLAELIGTAIALKLLFGLPLAVGVALTVLDVMLVLVLQQHGMRRLEAVVIALVAVVAVCMAWAVAIARPEWRAVLAGFVPDTRLVTDPGMLYIAIGVVGATVMPHNLYLHSSVAQRLRTDASPAGARPALARATRDICAALALAVCVNASILVLAGAAFHAQGRTDVAGLSDAHALLASTTAAGVAGTAFAVALLAAGQSSSVTATLAGQIVMEGFLRFTIPPWVRRLVTRAVAVVPALVVVLVWGEDAVGRLLIASQVVLSLQLPFAIVPLVRYTASRRIMGIHASPRLVTAVAAAIAATIVILNAVLVWEALT